ncbi:hypothetical protein DSM112329_04813 [Paraconexibacter sp. AEG42_29]|uniref:PucR family transcriptional regulator n=1 Tax=Paraconexibacter sp. AEG42_29 TaxID=2997339 RepID=A0AAU7B1W7_9ACTN
MAVHEEHRLAGVGGPKPDPAADARATAETQRLALELLPHSDLVAAAVTERVLEVIPDLAPDAAADGVAVTRESTDQNIGAMLATLAFGVPPSAIEPPLGTQKLLRQAVAAGGDATMVLHAYRVGHERLWQLWSDHAVANVADPELLHAVLRTSSTHFFAFIDRSCERLVDEYRREFAEARLTGPEGAGAGASRSELIDALLGDEAVDLEAARVRLGYDIAGHHTAIVLRPITAEADARAALDALVAAATTAAAAHAAVNGRAAAGPAAPAAPRVLTRPAGDGAWWAWVGWWPDAPPAAVRDALAACATDGIVAALGQPGRGRDGFRRSHEQALDAERIARLARQPRAGVVRHEEVELAGLLCHDRARAERLAAGRLGVLSQDDDATARLRETLRAYLASGGSKKRTAAMLHVHQKTVAYRLTRVEQLLGRRLAGDTAELDAALRIHLTLHGS